MKFSISCQRAFIGNNIDVQVDAEDKEKISLVTCNLDGTDLSTDDFSENPIVSFHRTFSQVRDAQPGLEHRLLVKAQLDQAGESRVGTRIWTDPN